MVLEIYWLTASLSAKHLLLLDPFLIEPKGGTYSILLPTCSSVAIGLPDTVGQAIKARKPTSRKPLLAGLLASGGDCLHPATSIPNQSPTSIFRALVIASVLGLLP